MPLSFETFQITVFSAVSFEYPEAALGTKNYVTYSKLPSGRPYRRHESGKDIYYHKEEKGCFVRKAAEELGTIFSLPSLKINKMIVFVCKYFSNLPKSTKTENAGNLFFRELKRSLSALPHHLQVQEVKCLQDMQYEHHLSVIPYLKPGMLKSIEMRNIGRGGQFNQILNMEQVQQAKSVKLNSYLDSFPFHSSLRNQEISVRLNNFFENDLNRLIRKYLNYDTFEKVVILNYDIQDKQWMKKYVSKHKKQGNDVVTMIALVNGPRFQYEVMVEEDLVTIRRKRS